MLNSSDRHLCFLILRENVLGEIPEHLARIKSSQPVAVGVGVVAAGPATKTLDKRNSLEVFQTGARRGQGLSRALGTHAGLLRRHEETSVLIGQKMQIRFFLFSTFQKGVII